MVEKNGIPSAIFTNAIDDYYMKISHVIKGKESLYSTYDHLIIYDYLNLKPPLFAHVPLIRKGKKKLR